MKTEQLSFDEKIKSVFSEIDLATELPIVTGYTKCREGIMGTYDRGYTEITFSKIGVLADAREAIHSRCSPWYAQGRYSTQDQ